MGVYTPFKKTNLEMCLKKKGPKSGYDIEN